MKKTLDGFRAHAIEELVAPSCSDYENKTVFVLDGQPGLYRQKQRRRGEPAPGGSVRAWFQGEIVNLVRVQAVEDELAEAGFVNAVEQSAPLTADQPKEADREGYLEPPHDAFASDNPPPDEALPTPQEAVAGL